MTCWGFQQIAMGPNKVDKGRILLQASSLGEAVDVLILKPFFTELKLYQQKDKSFCMGQIDIWEGHGL